MTILRFLFRNWALKLAAIVLSVLLYGGLVLSQNANVFDGRVPIEAVFQPTNVVVLSNLGDVTTIRYFAPQDLNVRLDSSAFHATVDLSSVNPSLGHVSLAVRVEAVDPRIQILDYEPRRVNVTLDQVVHKDVPIQVDRGVVPPGLDVRQPVLATTTATVTGPQSIVERVVAAVARVQIDASGVDIDRDVELVPVDALGEVLSPVDVSPATVRVKIAVFTNRQTRTLPVVPIITGSPAPGFEVASVTVTPLVVAVEGDADQLASLTTATTLPLSISGASATQTSSVALDLPLGVLSLGPETVSVQVVLRAVTETRTFSAGILLTGDRPDRTYALSTDRVLVTVGGGAADLDRLSGATFAVTADVTGLDVGTHAVRVRAALPAGLTLVGAAPSTITVTIGLPSASAAPSAPASPTPGP